MVDGVAPNMSGREVRSVTSPATVGGGTDARSVVRSPEGFRLGAKALVVVDDEVLLVEERHADGTAFWTLPGGGLYPGETPVDCLRRELAEELQCRVHVEGPATLCRYDHRSSPGTSLYAVLRATVESDPVPNPSEGVYDVEWVPRTAPPEGLLSPFRRLFDPAAGADAD